MHAALFVALLSVTSIATGPASAAPENVSHERRDASLFNDASLSEAQKKLILQVGVYQARLFCTKNSIVRTSTADPGIADVIVVNEKQLYIRGILPGHTSVTLWDNCGAVIHLELRVEKKRGLIGSTMVALQNGMEQRFLPTREDALTFANNAKLPLEECAPVKELHYNQRQEPVSLNNSRCSTQANLPHEDILTYNNTEQVKVRSGFSSKNLKTTGSIELLVSQSRVFQSKNGLATITICDPCVSEPIVVAKREIVLVAKSPGKTVLTLSDDLGKEEAFKVTVRKQSNPVISALGALRGLFLTKLLHAKTNVSFPSISNDTLQLAEIDATPIIDLETSHPRMFRSKNRIVRTVVGAPKIAEALVVSSTEIALRGITPGTTTIFAWDKFGKVTGMTVTVKGKPAPTSQLPAKSDPYIDAMDPHEKCVVESWFGARKELFEVQETLQHEMLREAQ